MNNKEKIVGFAGHRNLWDNVGIEKVLEKNIIELIEKGYTVFYCGGKGYFDKLSCNIVLKLKKIYPQIKVFEILSQYNEKLVLSPRFDGSIYPDLETCHFKARITKRNQWIVDNIDLLVCYVHHTYKSGAFKTVKYARENGKPIIYLEKPQDTKK